MSKNKKLTFKIEGMDCPDCALTIEKGVRSMPGVDSVKIDFIDAIMTVEGIEDSDRIGRRVKSLGYGAKAVSGSLTRTTTLLIPDMDCADEERIIRKALSSSDQVSDLRFDLIGRKVVIIHSTSPSSLLDLLRREGFEAKIADSGPSESPIGVWKIWSVVIAGLLVSVGAILHSFGASGWLYKPIILSGVLIGGWKIGHKGLVAARRLRLDMNFLMSLAVAGAIVIGQWVEAGTVIVLFAIAQLLESYSLDRSRRAIKSLIDLAPKTATVIRDGREMAIPAEEVKSGDRIIVKPGEKIPVDGRVVSGKSSINQAPITGEPLPATVSAGDYVFAGTINNEGSIDIDAVHLPGDTTLDRIIKLVEEARATRAPSQRFVDRFSRVYTPIVVSIAVVVAIVPPLLTGALWLDWIYRSLTLLVIACPCALVISTPVTIVSALTGAAHNGVLIKGGAFLENLHKTPAIAFDKTGTITRGRPVVNGVIPTNESSLKQIIGIAATLERRSEHPIAYAIIRHAGRLNAETGSVENFSSIPGKGARGTISGEEYFVGNHVLFEELGICDDSVHRELEAVENESQTAILVGTRGKTLGIITISDEIRPDIKRSIKELDELGVKGIIMLSGDNHRTATAVGKAIGISDIRAELLPDQKVAEMKKIKSSMGSAAMVGDGINDAPALAAADIGIAMGVAGSDIALDTADIALMSDEPSKIPWAFRLSKKAYDIIVENIVMAIGIKAIFVVLALTGIATLWMAVFADMGVSLMVILNGMRALRSN